MPMTRRSLQEIKPSKWNLDCLRIIYCFVITEPIFQKLTSKVFQVSEVLQAIRIKISKKRDIKVSASNLFLVHRSAFKSFPISFHSGSIRTISNGWIPMITHGR